jgi:RNA polymerase sigma-B factor
VTDRPGGWSTEQRARERELLARLTTLDPEHPERAGVRDELVVLHLPLVRYLAHRYRSQGESLDDVTQVGTLGLLKAVDRFDPERGTAFSTFATPTIIGEIKRHYRDNTWSLRLPRGLKERVLQVGRRTDELTVAAGRAPTVAELAEDLDLTDEEVIEAIEARHAYSAESFDPHPDAGHDERFGVTEAGFESVEDLASLQPLLAALPERERAILALRFTEELSQAQIADRLGISQMHVSRLLARTLAQLRAGLADA